MLEKPLQRLTVLGRVDRPLAGRVVVEARTPHGSPVRDAPRLLPGNEPCLDQITLRVVLVVPWGQDVEVSEGLGWRPVMDGGVVEELIEVELLEQTPYVAAKVDHIPGDWNEVA